MNEQVYEFLSALIRVKSSARYDGGVCVEMAVERLVKALEGLLQSSISIM